MDFKILKNTDIYLIDQILKGRFENKKNILDAGCGSFRNSHYFIQNNYNYIGIDNSIKFTKNITQIIGNIDHIPVKTNYFDGIICNAVLHFSKDSEQFNRILNELFRVLKSKGILFVRTAVKNGIENQILKIEGNTYKLPDGTTRFLTDFHNFEKTIKSLNGKFIEPLKTSLVNNQRSMATFVIEKN